MHESVITHSTYDGRRSNSLMSEINLFTWGRNAIYCIICRAALFNGRIIFHANTVSQAVSLHDN